MAEFMEWTIVLQDLGGILLVKGAFELTIKIYRFVRRARTKAQEISPTLESRKALGLWNFMILPFALSSIPIAAIVLYLTMNVEFTLLAFVMVIGYVSFLWAIWAIVPAFVEMIRESLMV